MSNEVPQLFDWDQAHNQPGDRWARTELNHSVIEFVCAHEYMVCPPSRGIHIFLIDVSHAAIHSGDTSTQMYYYTFNAVRLEDVLKFAHEFGEVLVMLIMLEVVICVRASGGAFSYLNFS
jgi:hypothetical protein